MTQRGSILIKQALMSGVMQSVQSGVANIANIARMSTDVDKRERAKASLVQQYATAQMLLEVINEIMEEVEQ